jgi:hypothetical protein
MFALDRTERSALAAVGIAALLAAFAAAPSRAGNSPAATPIPGNDAGAARAVPTDIALLRDPFGPEGDLATPAPAAATLPRLEPLPPNAGAGPFPFGSPAAGPRVLAVVEGPLPRALVDDANGSRVVGSGDRFAGARIVRIDRDGLVLAGGRRFSIDPEHRP